MNPCVLAGAAAAGRNQDVAETVAMPFNAAWSEVDRVAPAVTSHPRITFATTAVALAGGFAYYSRYRLPLSRQARCLLLSSC